MEEKNAGNFAGFVLLSEPEFDKEKFISDLKNDWEIDVSEGNIEDDNPVIYADVGNFRITVGLIEAPVPNGEAEYFAEANYMWQEAVQVTKSHKAQILVAVLGDDDNAVEKGKLFVKAAGTALKQEKAIAIYTEGAVYEPGFYIDFANLMKEGYFPLMNLVWFGLYRDDERAGVYTYGLKRFGKEEMEIHTSPEKADFNEIRNFAMRVCEYVILNDVVMKSGETIGATEDQAFPITESDGIAVDGKSLKIAYE